MFYIDIKQNENNKNVYKIEKLGNSIVICEPPHAQRMSNMSNPNALDAKLLDILRNTAENHSGA